LHLFKTFTLGNIVPYFLTSCAKRCNDGTVKRLLFLFKVVR